MNASNSQGYYDEFFKTFKEKGWTLFNQKIYTLEDEKVLGSELLLRVGITGSYLDNSAFFPEICNDPRYLEVSFNVLNLVEHIISNSPKLFFDRTFVNISPSEIRDAQIFSKLLKIVQLFLKEDKKIVLELSEICKPQEFKEILDKFNEITSNGGEIAIDDYGKGILTYEDFDRIKLSFIKLDKTISTQKSIKNDSLKKMVNYCEVKNICCIAEGLETEASVKKAMENNIFIGQGFHFHKPEKFNS